MYALTKNRVVIEGIEVDVYGISYDDAHSVVDVSTDRDEVLGLVNNFNKYGLEPIHLYDAIEDFFGDKI